MEVHHHVHSRDTGHTGKKWTHYFWEFLMLFLAVFCGFLAENFREHSIEHKRARQFAASLLNDLKEDTAALRTVINYGRGKVSAVDSLIMQIESPREKWNDTLIYTYQGRAGRIRPFAHNSGTYDQMKSSGSLRYFKQDLTDLLNQYAVQANKTRIREDIHLNYASNLLNPLIFRIADSRAMIQIQNGMVPTHPLVFHKTDAETIGLWINYATAVQSTQERTVVEYDSMLRMANRIILAIKQEYNIE
jgi:hypothetical protein